MITDEKPVKEGCRRIEKPLLQAASRPGAMAFFAGKNLRLDDKINCLQRDFIVV